jgi:hypothetical protein
MRDEALPGPARILAYCLDPLIRVERSVTVAWQAWLPLVRRLS